MMSWRALIAYISLSTLSSTFLYVYYYRSYICELFIFLPSTSKSYNSLTKHLYFIFLKLKFYENIKAYKIEEKLKQNKGTNVEYWMHYRVDKIYRRK